jgi:DNA-directed RNA polymerase specialized sigma subunit
MKRTKIPELLYTKYKALIKDRAYNQSIKCGIDFDELECQANLIFMKAYHQFDKNRGVKFCTYLYNSLSRELWKFSNKEEKQIKIAQSIKTNDIQPNDFVEKNEFWNSIKRLSTETRQVIELIFSAPKELLSMNKSKGFLCSKKITKSLLFIFLKYHGWRKKDINNSFKEIKEKILV